MRAFIQTYTEKIFYFDDPYSYEFTIEEIAFALSQQCRYNCQVPFYCVAQHSYLISYQLPDELSLAGLMHDTAEAYLPDMSSPLKSMIRGFKELEDNILRAIAQQFGLDFNLFGRKELLEVDKRILMDEKKVLFDDQSFRWFDDGDPLGIDTTIQLDKPFSHWKMKFMRRFEELRGN